MIGNPNVGKTSVFNSLTGLSQKVGNFPGVTVEKSSGILKIDQKSYELIDLPGIYSLNPRSLDELVSVEELLKLYGSKDIEGIIYVSDIYNLRRNLLLFSQLVDLNIPIILVITRIDLAKRRGLFPDADKLSKVFGVPVVLANPREDEGTLEIKSLIKEGLSEPKFNYWFFKSGFAGVENYWGWVIKKADHHKSPQGKEIEDYVKKEFEQRYEKIDLILESAFPARSLKLLNDTFSSKIDRILTHKVYGYLIFLSVLFLIFQSIFSLATPPMDFIEMAFGQFAELLSLYLPQTWWADLISRGIVPGIAGVVVFIPQIAFLFFFLALLEESGYMARVTLINDHWMRKAGLNGRSVVPLLSGAACAIPAILSARTIPNAKERLITIMVTPFISCSARLPVYTLLISLFVPEDYFLGIFSMQALWLLAMYLLGVISALGVAFILEKFVGDNKKGRFIIELPEYQFPRWKNVWITIVEKCKHFVFGAGKVILAVAVVLWFLASFAPEGEFEKIEAKYSAISADSINQEHINAKEAELLEVSYAGILGKSIEPAIKPLGYDWKIGIALISSFAAREVFVSTMSTIFSLGSGEDDNAKIKDKMLAEKDLVTGKPLYDKPVAISLMIFYAFAMQCMSTIAVMYKESGGWKWPAIQFVIMTSLAYLGALAGYHLFS